MSPIDSLNDEERHKFLRVVQDSMHIYRHFHLYLWLRADLQYFLPHEILLSISGNFARRQITMDVVSGLPGVNTANSFKCGVDDIANYLYECWQQNNRRCLAVTSPPHLLPDNACTCEIHTALRGMRSIIVHGVRDERTGQDSLYLFLHSQVGMPNKYHGMVDMLLPQIDFAYKRIACLKPDGAVEDQPARLIKKAQESVLSPREIEIMEWVRLGKTNSEIGSILNISELTAKNHLRHIFRKLDVSNRAQAVATWHDLSTLS
ncbi:MAG: LuxR C-terminal-related transcriptional regulator [Rhodocyclaceae bacterium]|nr:LuxR C-terminal-related transcriptional regulator [Rhodocyclaceae bacterium]